MLNRKFSTILVASLLLIAPFWPMLEAAVGVVAAVAAGGEVVAASESADLAMADWIAALTEALTMARSLLAMTLVFAMMTRRQCKRRRAFRIQT